MHCSSLHSCVVQELVLPGVLSSTEIGFECTADNVCKSWNIKFEIFNLWSVKPTSDLLLKEYKWARWQCIFNMKTNTRSKVGVAWKIIRNDVFWKYIFSAWNQFHSSFKNNLFSVRLIIVRIQRSTFRPRCIELISKEWWNIFWIKNNIRVMDKIK